MGTRIRNHYLRGSASEYLGYNHGLNTSENCICEWDHSNVISLYNVDMEVFSLLDMSIKKGVQSERIFYLVVQTLRMSTVE